MIKFTFFACLFACQTYIMLLFTSMDSHLNRTQLKNAGLNNHFAVTEHGAVYANVVLAAFAIYILGTREMEWVSWRSLGLLLGSALASVALMRFYVSIGINDPFVHDGRVVAGGWYFGLFMTEMFWVFGEVYLGWTGRPSHGELAALGVMFACYFVVSIMKFNFEMWQFQPRDYGQIAACMAVITAASFCLW
ncbi:MAG: hypothetical protein WC030_00460 [Candidatus Paceibacterota bacterium]